MTNASTGLRASQRDIDAIREAALDYIQGYTTGDTPRHTRAYHPECIKRRFVTDPDTGVERLQVLSPRIMADYTAAVGSNLATDSEPEIIIDAISQDIASVRVYSTHWIDFLHLVRARGEWKLFHATWHDRDDQ